MKWLAYYLPNKLPAKRLVKTIWADSEPEANRQADKWYRKTHLLWKVEQQL